LRGNFNQLKKLKAQYPQLQTLISVGGWTWSGNFASVAATDASRKAFATSCADFMETYGFDGIDVDWEYPVSGGLTTGTAADTANYTLLMKEMRAELDRREAAAGQDYLLTIATGAGPDKVANLDVPGLANTLDWINLMAYDYNGAWAKTTGHNAALERSAADNGPLGWDVLSSVDAYLATGMPSDKLVLGVPLYGRGWSGVQPGSTGTGLYSLATGASTGTWEAGILDYDDIVAKYLPTMTRYWDAESQVPYLYDGATWISYDDAESMTAKAELIRDRGLGGAMMWELSGDRDGVLIDAVNNVLR